VLGTKVMDLKKGKMTAWQQWLERPDKSRVRNVFFQVHFWMGAAAGAYTGLLAFTGVFICCRRVIYKKPSNPRSQLD